MRIYLQIIILVLLSVGGCNTVEREDVNTPIPVLNPSSTAVPEPIMESNTPLLNPSPSPSIRPEATNRSITFITDCSPTTVAELVNKIITPTPAPTSVISLSITPLPASLAPYIYVTQWGTGGVDDGQFSKPWGIAIDGEDNIYVSDSENNCIQKFDRNGAFITKWGGKGSQEGLFNSPEGITIDLEGNVYIADAKNKRIQKFTSYGEFITAWSGKDSKDKQLAPVYLETAPDGNIYVVNWLHRKPVKILDPVNSYITDWAPEEISDINGIKVDSEGFFYIVHTVVIAETTGEYNIINYLYKSAITKYDPSGKAIAYWPLQKEGESNYSVGITIDKKGYFYVGSFYEKYIQVVDPEGHLICRWGTEGTGNGQFDYPENMAVDSEGNLYVVDANNNRIQKFRPNPEFKFENFKNKEEN